MFLGRAQSLVCQSLSYSCAPTPIIYVSYLHAPGIAAGACARTGLAHPQAVPPGVQAPRLGSHTCLRLCDLSPGPLHISIWFCPVFLPSFFIQLSLRLVVNKGQTEMRQVITGAHGTSPFTLDLVSDSSKQLCSKAHPPGLGKLASRVNV